MYWPTIAGAVYATLSQSCAAAGQGDFFYNRGFSLAARFSSAVTVSGDKSK